MTMSEALISVVKERARQDDLWGEQNNDPVTWLVILMEEVGEIARAILSWRFDGPIGSRGGAIRDEAVQVAAVAVAMVECCDRNDWTKIRDEAREREGE